jgi:hypothetical protein
MEKTIVCQGRELNSTELSWLQSWITQHRDWSRHRLAQELCRHWNWRTACGRLKNFAARSLLLKLEQRGLVSLPPLRVAMRRNSWSEQYSKVAFEVETHRTSPPSTPIAGSLAELKPLNLLLPNTSSFEDRSFGYYLTKHHYLGLNRTVGENIKYLVRDRHGRDLACLLFGSAAWKTAPRDTFIGWSDQIRQLNINFLTNNTRFLILPWVQVPHLASHILGLVMRRLRADWQSKYAHPIHIVETFVERDRFRGTCYQAANWLCVGQTRGRSRQDRHQTLKVPIKDIYLYPLTANFRKELCYVYA